jgi:hypothetical protein
VAHRYGYGYGVERTSHWAVPVPGGWAIIPPAEAAQAAERIAREVRQRTRALRYPTPGHLARALDPTTVQTPALDVIDTHLRHVGDGITSRLGVFMPPQEGKSTRVAVFGALWLLLRNPDLRIVIASYEQGLAVRSSKAIRDLIETHGSGTARQPVPLTDDLLSLALAEDSGSMAQWSLKGHRGGVLAVGIGGAFTGRPADVLLIDDPIKDARAADSPLIRQRAWEWWTHVARVRVAPGGAVILVQTRWHEDDVAGRLLAEQRNLYATQRRWVWCSIPAQAEAPRPDDPEKGRLPDALGRPPGEYLLSARGRTEAEWEETRRDVGTRSWSALFQQHPSPSEGAVFRWSWFHRTRRPPDQPLPDARVTAVAVDTSAGGSDEAGIVAGFRGADGRGYVTDDRSGNMTEAEWSRAAWLLAVDIQADRIVWEKNLAGPTMARQIKAAWTLLQRQARTLRRHRGDVDAAAMELTAADAGVQAGGFAFDGPAPDVDPELLAETRAALLDLTPERMARVLSAPESGYCALKGVSATKGKRTRATPIATAFETGRASLVGNFPELETQAAQWQEGQDSPDRMDALVWLLTDILAAAPAGTTAPPVTTIPTGAITGRR